MRWTISDGEVYFHFVIDAVHFGLYSGIMSGYCMVV